MFVTSVGPAEPDPDFDRSTLRFDTSVCGSGTFGVVTRASLMPNGDPVAIKRVLQDPHYKACSLFFLDGFIYLSFQPHFSRIVKFKS